MDQFYRSDSRWLATLEAAIGDLGIPDEEVEELAHGHEPGLPKRKPH